MESVATGSKRILHDRGICIDVHADVEYRHCYRDIQVACNAVCRVQRVLVHCQINVVCRLNEIVHEAGISRIAPGHSSLVWAGLQEAWESWTEPREGLMLQDSRNFAGILPIDGIEIEVLKAERHVKFVAPYRVCALAENWP